MFVVKAAIACAVVSACTVDKTPALKKRVSRDLRTFDMMYQRLIRRTVDPLFSAKERRSQLTEYSNGVDENEKSVNRTLGLSALTTIMAGAGAIGVPALSIASAVGLTAIVTPLILDVSKTVSRTKKIKYRLIRLVTIPLALFSGFYFLINIMTFVFLATYKVAARTKAAAHESMRDAFSLQPPTEVWVEVDDVQVRIPFNKLRAGDVICVEAGQTIPVDGEILGGEAVVNQQVMTGEARPADKTTGDSALANTLIIRGSLRIRVEKTGDETAAAQIADILMNASESRLKAADLSERVLDHLTLPMVGISSAALATVGPGGAIAIFNGGFATTALMSGPLCMLTYLNMASQHGVLIKDGRSLESLREVTVVVFDKTGTLTTEIPRVGVIHTTDKFDEDSVLRYAALAEYRQTHPLAKAILAAAEEEGIQIDAPDEAAYSMGMGIVVQIGAQTIRVGSARFMQQNDIDVTSYEQQWRTESDRVGGSLVFVAVDNVCAGAIRLETQMRPETDSLLESLHQRGLKTYILSGDHKAPTAHLAQELGMTGYFAEVLPDDKEEIIRNLQAQGESVCFVGDGLNDALALRQADVSISMRGATSVATDSAQIVMMSSSLTPIEMLLDLSRSFHNMLLRTMILGYIPGIALIGGVFLMGMGMPAAFLAYTASMAGGALSALSPPRLPESAKLLSPEEEVHPATVKAREETIPVVGHGTAQDQTPDLRDAA